MMDVHRGLRGITDSGKNSSSRFKLVSYDKDYDQSLILCFPITGRSHQLRVHLAWINHPIVGDSRYGGRPFEFPSKWNNGERLARNAAVDAIIKANQLSCTVADDMGIEHSVCDICKCCKGPHGIRSCFDEAQLLEGGHIIALHALKYRIWFPASSEADFEVLEKHGTYVDLEVDLPKWVTGITISALPWLT